MYHEYHQLILVIPMENNNALSLKDASSLIPGLPSLITLKRMSAAGKLDSALTGHAPGRYKTRLYDPARLAAIFIDSKPSDSAAPPPQHQFAQRLDKSLEAAPLREASAISDDIQALRIAVAEMRQQIIDLKPHLEDLAATKRALQLKYDAENQALRQQRDALMADIKEMRTKSAEMDMAHVHSKLNQIALRLGA